MGSLSAQTDSIPQGILFDNKDHLLIFRSITWEICFCLHQIIN